MNKWIKKNFIYNETLFSHKNKEILPFVTTQMELEGIRLSKMSGRERQILQNITYM